MDTGVHLPSGNAQQDKHKNHEAGRYKDYNQCDQPVTHDGHGCTGFLQIKPTYKPPPYRQS